MITTEQLGTQIIREASRFVGLREVRPNTSWDNPSTFGPDAVLVQELKKLMRPSPWQEGWAYCAAFAEAVVRSALIRLNVKPVDADKFLRVMSPHCMTSVHAFKRLGLLSEYPQPGAIWLAQHGASDRGHAGIVTAHDPQPTSAMRIVTIEGNTALDSTNAAKDREGDWITTRLMSRAGRGSLRTQGFITPASILKLITEH